jgi:hypothetical protein
LLGAHLDETVLYYLTDYHWLVVHDALLSLCVGHNNTPAEFPRVGPYRIGALDFNQIVDKYFWDVDFLIPEIVDLTSKQRESAGISPEAWAIAAHLKPHRDELRLIPSELERSPSPCQGPRQGRLARYPHNAPA